MAIKVQAKKKKVDAQSQKESIELQEQIDETQQSEVTTDHSDQWHSAQQSQWNVDLWNVLMQMTQMMWQTNEMLKMMDERMKKLEQETATKVTGSVEGEVVKEPEVVNAINEDNTASYNREDDDYAEIVNKVWKILYVTAQAPVTRWMQDAAPMMEPVCERRRVWNQVVSDTKYFPSEDAAKAYIENLRQKGITLPGAKIISCYI